MVLSQSFYETHDTEVIDTTKKTVSLSGKEYQVANGFNLYIDISSACNASCPFCIAPTIGRKDGSRFFDGAKFALNLTESIDGTVQVVGGEPLISKRLIPLLYEFSEHNYRRVVINTNGSCLSDKIVSAMKENGVTHVNVSRHHYDEGNNQEVMRLKPELSNKVFATGLERVAYSGIKTRMQCNLIKGHIDSLQEVINYTDWCSNDMGCKNISFSQIFPLSLFDYQIPIEPGYAEKVQIDLGQLVSEIDNCGMFSQIPTNHLDEEGPSPWGTSRWNRPGIGGKRRFWFGPNGTYISLKTLSGYDESGLPKETIYNKQDDPELQEGILEFAVLHSDGLVTASWDRRERLLFNPYLVQIS